MSKIKFKQIPSLSKTDIDRYWAQVDRSSDDRGCWTWTGSFNSKGYGRFFVNGRHQGAHRLSWLLTGRAIQRDLQICHTCDNRRCVNPDHLIMADAATNNRDSTLKRNLAGKRKRIKKPYPAFPLFPHATGRWAKKIAGRTCYFGGVVDDPKGEKALEKLNREWPYLSEGRTPPPVDATDGCSLRVLCNTFLTSKRNKLDAGELSPQTFADYYNTCKRLIDHFGKDRRVDDLRPDDFERFRKVLASEYGTVTLKNEINRCRVVFKFARDQRLIAEVVHYGQSFNKPSAKMLRKARHEAGPNLLTADEVRRMLEAADPIMRAMILLGCNAGFGNTDVASLPQSAIDFENDWLQFPRPKTEIPRRIPLWPETTQALREAISMRPQPNNREDGTLCFVTVQGNRWVRTQPSKSNPERFVTVNTIAARCSRLLKQLGINGRKRLGYYSLRHTFRTVADECKDQPAINALMGHVDSSMAGLYREGISDERLQAVADTVHAWLWPNPPAT